MLRQSRYGGSHPASTAVHQTFVAWLGCTATQAVFTATLYVKRACAELRRRHQQRIAIRQLSEMSDRLLNDIGLSRADIELAVRTGRPRRPERTD